MLLIAIISKAQQLTGGGEANPTLRTDEIALAQWQDMRYGLFIHWGPVSLRGTEIGWSRGREVPFDEYDALYREFNPVLFDAREWVFTMKKAGMRYLVFVSKHHDGFVMWDSKTTDYDIMSTPFHRDILAEISEECRRQGILFGTYYSIADWWHPDYPVEYNRGRKEGSDMDRYVAYMKAQLKELVLEYQTRIVWFDGEWEEPWTHALGMELYRYLRTLDDNLLINNRVDKGRKGMEGTSESPVYAGDFATPEQRIGKFDTLTPWESCITVASQWAWKPNDALKSKEECIQTLIRTVGGGGNLLLNIGPMADGRIEQRQSDLLIQMGDWLEDYGETVYGTQGGPLPPQDWGVMTQDDTRIFLHIMEDPGKQLELSGIPAVEYARVYASGEKVEFSFKGTSMVLHLQDHDAEAIDYVIELGKKHVN
jgi:alpha-L-fucosidase